MKKIFSDAKTNWIGFIILVIVFMIGNSMFFSLKEYEKASAFSFGKFSREYMEAGLHIKAPWPFETLYRVDTRLQLYNAKEMTIQERSKKKLLIDYFVLYRVNSPKLYFTKVGGNKRQAIHRVDDHTSSDVAAVVGETNFDDVVTNKRQQLLDSIKAMSNRGLNDIALEVQFISFNRVELPDENKLAVFQDMIKDRNKISSLYLAEGQQIKDSIQSYADYEAANIVATARMRADSIRGAADAERLHILNEGYAQSQKLFAIYNKIETYKKSFKGDKTEWIMQKSNALSPIP
jgi:membrane protease subunit HflC